jgi:hypothetical protein
MASNLSDKKCPFNMPMLCQENDCQIWNEDMGCCGQNIALILQKCYTEKKPEGAKRLDR